MSEQKSDEQTTAEVLPDVTPAPAAEGLQSTETPEGTQIVSTPDDAQDDDTAPIEGDTFPRSYVEKLRDENAKYRQRAGQADDLAQRLHTSLVAATGRLQDPSDLPFDETHLDDPEALTQAIDALLAEKPHLASRTPRGDIGQGVSGADQNMDLGALIRARL
jgi:hypothetical protein